MSWVPDADRQLFDLFEDLEQQAEGLALSSREGEVAELAREEYAEVDLAGRVHASVGRAVRLGLAGGSVLSGEVTRSGRGWLLLAGAPLDGGPVERWVNLAALAWLSGGSARSTPAPARGVHSRLGAGSCLRGLAAAQDPLVVHLVDGHTRRRQIFRVGADFVELRDERGVTEVAPFSALVWVGPGG